MAANRFRFRAWDKERKEMFYDVERTYDGLSDYGGDTESGMDSFGKFFCQCMWNDPEEMLYFTDEPRFVIMQSTGLQDKQGKEIFEGDLLRFEPLWDEGYLMVGVVAWAQGTFILKDGKGEKIRQWNDGSNEWYSIENLPGAWPLVEVIGNVHQNPELLEARHDRTT